MGIQINGQTDTVTSTTSGGSVTVTSANFPSVSNLNATGIVTATGGFVVGSGTSISSPSSNVLAFGTNNNERVRVSAGGISIGTVTTYGDGNASFTSLSLGGNGTRYGLLEIKQSNSVAGSWIDCYGTNGNGDLRITTAGTSNNITFWTGGAFTEKVRITSDGNVGVGLTNPSQKLEVVGGEIKAGRVDSTNEGGQVTFGRSTDNASAWYIDVYGNTSTPSLRFVDVSTASVRANIDSSGNFTVNSGNLVIGTSGKGIDFSAGANAAGMTSEVLNDYEEGTFTPTGNNITYSAASGSYVKIGRMVMGTFNVTFPSTADGNTAELRSLPFTVTAGTAYQSGAYPCATDSSLTESTFFTATGTRFIFRNNSNGDRSNANFSGKFVQASFVYYTDS
jgi:hypothetical protein